MIVESLREALYRLLETKDIRDIKVVDLIRLAGVSRGAFYKNYYLVTDVLEDDIRAITEDVGAAMGRTSRLTGTSSCEPSTITGTRYRCCSRRAWVWRC